MRPFIITRDSPVIIVDDDPWVRDALTLLLKIEGFSSQTFGDGESFLEALQSAKPSCVILDLHLPGCSGLAVLRRLADARFAPPVFVMSGQSDIAMAVEAMKLGVADFMTKPIDGSVLKQKILKALSQSKGA